VTRKFVEGRQAAWGSSASSSRCSGCATAGSAHSFGFAICSPAHDRYEDAVLRTGLPIGSPQEALDTACTVHLAAPEP
jgi:hypothetical protein